MIKINLVREGRAVRGGGAAPVAMAGPAGGGARNINNILVLVLLIVGAVVAGIYWFITNNEKKQREETRAARKVEAEKLEAIIRDVENYKKRKDSLQKRIDLINQLKQNQKGPVRIMDRVSQDLPDLVWLDHMTIAGGRITLNGRGLNPNAIANFIENVKRDPFFEEPEVGTVTQVSAAPMVYSFDMGFAFTYTAKQLTPPGQLATDTAGTATSTGTTATTGTK